MASFLLSHLNLSFNLIGEKGVDSFCKALTRNECTLKYFNLANIVSMADEAIQKLLETLSKRKCNLSQLNISQNKINDTHVLAKRSFKGEFQIASGKFVTKQNN